MATVHTLRVFVVNSTASNFSIYWPWSTANGHHTVKTSIALTVHVWQRLRDAATWILTSCVFVFHRNNRIPTVARFHVYLFYIHIADFTTMLHKFWFSVWSRSAEMTLRKKTQAYRRYILNNLFDFRQNSTEIHGLILRNHFPNARINVPSCWNKHNSKKKSQKKNRKKKNWKKKLKKKIEKKKIKKKTQTNFDKIKFERMQLTNTENLFTNETTALTTQTTVMTLWKIRRNKS